MIENHSEIINTEHFRNMYSYNVFVASSTTWKLTFVLFLKFTARNTSNQGRKTLPTEIKKKKKNENNNYGW